MSSPLVIVVGLGEVGKPLMKILSRTYDCVGIDVDPVEVTRACSVLHVCIPFKPREFVSVCAEYIQRLSPALTIINSTVAPGATGEVARETNRLIAYSPVRGKHAHMEHDLLMYKKFVGADSVVARDRALQHFARAGFGTGVFPGSRAGELAKLIETTWLGLLVGWAQDVERIGATYGASYSELTTFTEEIPYLPQGIFPGFIGGHCVMPNIDILRSQIQSDFLDAIVKSNQKKADTLTRAARGGMP